MIGLCGAHRTGKTTLARTYAEATGFYFLETSAQATFKRLGFTPREEMSPEDRLIVQLEILNDLEDAYLSAPTGNFIADRTPIDAAAYMIAEIGRTTTKEDAWLEYELLRYVDRVKEITEQHFRLVVLVQPGIQIIDDENKAPASLAYIEHLNDIMVGLVMGRTDDGYNTNVAMIRRKMTSLHERVEILLNLTRRYFPDHMLLQENCLLM